MTGPVDWAPALVALAAGVLGGGAFAWRVYRRGRPPLAGEGGTTRDLQAKLDALLAQLRELDEAAPKRSPEPLARERHALELAAARTLRDLERSPASRLVPVTPVVPPADGIQVPPVDQEGTPAIEGRALRGFLWGTGTMAVLGLLLLYVSRSADERREGGSVTGNLPGEQPPSPAADPELARLEAAVERMPADVETRLVLARGYLARQDLMAVWNHTKAVLELVPGEPRALGYQALVRLAMGQGDLAEQMLKQALASRPDLVEGHLHLAIVYAQTGRPQQAEEVLDRALRQFPDDREALQRLREEIRALASQAASPELRDPHAGVAPPGIPAAADSIRGTIDLAPALAGQTTTGVVFVMLREAGASGGPPLAARRIDAARFPVAFEIGAGDSMMGGELPETLLVEARLDRDGNAASREASEPLARRDGVKRGSSGVVLILEAPRP